MSVVIKGMKIPKGCSFCKMKEQNRHGQCSITGTEWENDTMILLNFDSDKERLSDCPLVEIPANHGRLIDADDLMKRYNLTEATKYGNYTREQQEFSYSTMMMYEIADMVDDAPVVIDAEE